MNDDDNNDDDYSHSLNFRGFNFIPFSGMCSYGSLKPMTAYGRMDARLKEGDSNFARAGEEISEELTAALKRVAIVSRR